MEWARTAWIILGEHGLTERDDRDDFSDITTIGRMVALGLFYHTFATHAWDEGSPEPREWFGEHQELADVEVLR